METQKHILIVSRRVSESARLLTEGGPEDFLFHFAETPNAALRMVREKWPISLVVLDGGLLGPQAPNLYARLGKENDLPLLWVGGEGAEEPDFSFREPAGTLDEPVSAEEFAEVVRPILHDGFYPASLIQSLLSASNSVMTTTFQRSLEIGVPWLKLSGMVYGNVCALLPFRTERVLGHVLCAGEREHLADLGVEIGFDPGEGDRRIAQSVLAEISNVIIGRLAMDCANLLGEMRMGLPLVFAGDGMDLHSADKRPSVCVDVEDEWGKLHCEFLFQRAQLEGDEDPEMATAGDVLLF